MLGRVRVLSRLAQVLGRECPEQEAGTQEQEREQSRLVLVREPVQSRLELEQELSRLVLVRGQSRLELELVQRSPVQGAGTQGQAGLGQVHCIRGRVQSRWEQEQVPSRMELVRVPSRLELVRVPSRLELGLVRECPERGAGTRALAAQELGPSIREREPRIWARELVLSRWEREQVPSKWEPVLEQEYPAQVADTQEQAGLEQVHGIRELEPRRSELEPVPSRRDQEPGHRFRTRSTACRTSSHCLRPDSDARHRPTRRRLRIQPIRRISAKSHKEIRD